MKEEYIIKITVCDNGFLFESPDTCCVFDEGDEDIVQDNYNPALLKLINHLLYGELSFRNGSKFGEKQIATIIEEGDHYEKPEDK